MQHNPSIFQLIPMVTTCVTSELFRSTKNSRLWFLSGRRSEICGVRVHKCWRQRWKVLHHSQEPVASLKPEGNKIHFQQKQQHSCGQNVVDVVCLHSDCGEKSLFRAGALRCRPVALSPAARPKHRGRGECGVNASRTFKGVQRALGD